MDLLTVAAWLLFARAGNVDGQGAALEFLVVELLNGAGRLFGGGDDVVAAGVEVVGVAEDLAVARVRPGGSR